MNCQKSSLGRRKLDLPIEPEGAAEISHRSRGTPRISNRLLRRVRDVAEVKGDGVVTAALADDALNLLNVDKQALTQWIAGFYWPS